LNLSNPIHPIRLTSILTKLIQFQTTPTQSNIQSNQIQSCYRITPPIRRPIRRPIRSGGMGIRRQNIGALPH
jgi:hypothetical protein